MMNHETLHQLECTTIVLYMRAMGQRLYLTHCDVVYQLNSSIWHHPFVGILNLTLHALVILLHFSFTHSLALTIIGIWTYFGIECHKYQTNQPKSLHSLIHQLKPVLIQDDTSQTWNNCRAATVHCYGCVQIISWKFMIMINHHLNLSLYLSSFLSRLNR